MVIFNDDQTKDINFTNVNRKCSTSCRYLKIKDYYHKYLNGIDRGRKIFTVYTGSKNKRRELFEMLPLVKFRSVASPRRSNRRICMHKHSRKV